MAVITYETSDGFNRISSMSIEYDENRSSWVVDVSEGSISHVGQGVEELVIPETRVYQVELTSGETNGSGTF